METGLSGKRVLITGGTSGIGFGIAQVLAGEGMDIAVASRDPDIDAVEQLKAQGVVCLPIRVDVSREDEVVRMVREAIDGLGGLDCYVNNAAWTWHEPIAKLTTQSWRATLDTNLSAAMWAMREVANHMAPFRQGSIVIIGSTVRCFPAHGETAYRVSKMGLKMLVEQLAVELAPCGIRANMVTPGHFRTRMTAGISEEAEEAIRDLIPLQRFGQPSEIGYAVAFLLSDRLSPYTTGADLVVDGGLVMHPLRPLMGE